MKKFTLLCVAVLTYSLVTAQLSGLKSIPGDYASIQAAIADLNTQGVGSGGVIFDVAANHTETLAASNSGIITATGTASDTVVFRKDPSTTGNNPKIIAFTPGTSTTVDGIIKIAGGDYITFDGIDLVENPSNTNITKMMEWGYALVKKQSTAPFDGCQYVVIRNCTITLNKINFRSVGIYSGNHIATNTTSLTLTATTDAMNNTRIYGNTISNVYEGIHLYGYSHPYPGPYTLYDHNNRIGVEGANHISNFGNTGATNYTYGIFGICQEYLQVANNVISSGAGTNSTVYGIYLSGSYNASADVFNNDISLSATSSSPIKGIYVGYGGVVSSNTISIHDNFIHDCSYSAASAGTFFGIDQCSHTTTANIYNNHIYNNTIYTTGGFYGISGMSEQVTYLNIYGNQIHDNQVTGAEGSMFCITGKNAILSVHDNDIYNNSFPASAGYAPSRIYGYFNDQSPTVSEDYYDNHIYNLSVGGTSTYANSIFGIYTKSAGTSMKNISGNSIHGFHISSPGGGKTTGIHNWGGNLISIQNNEIFDLETDSSDALSYGIDIQYGTTVNMYNNIISDLRTPQSYYGSAIKGIYLEGGGNLNLYYNTIFLNAASSTTLRFGSAGIVSSASPIVDLRNNLIINLSTSVHLTNNAYTAAFVRTSINLDNYSAASNNNCFYAGTPGPFNVIYWDGTNTDSTMTAYQARVSPRDSQSFSENAPFINNFYAPYNLHLQNDTYTRCESGGTVISTTAVDIDGDARYPHAGYPDHPLFPATAPDVGADEFGGIPLNKSLTLILLLEGLYSGGGMMNPASDENGPEWGPKIADHISVELHEAVSPFAKVEDYEMVLHTNGVATTLLDSPITGSYYIVVKHRNSIQTWSSSPVSFDEALTSYNFSEGIAQAFGSNLLQAGSYAVVYGGDVNQDGLVDSSDMIEADNDASTFVSGFVHTDVNGDGLVDSSDLILIDNNAGLFISAVIPY